MSQPPLRDLTPIQIEQKMHKLVLDLEVAQKSLAKARDEEVDAKHAYEAKRRRMVLSPDCPRPGTVKDGGKVTVDERNAWVEDHCEEEEHRYNIAMVKREAAKDYLQTLRDQSMLVMSLARSMQVTMGLAGRAEPQWTG